MDSVVDSRQLTVSVLDQPADLVRLKPEWQKLQEAGGDDVFTAWEWMAPWFRHLGNRRRLFVLLACDHMGQPRGLLPLGLSETRIGFQRVRRLGFLADDHVCSDYLDLIAQPGWREPVIAACGRELARRDSEWDVIELLGMDDRSDTAEDLLEAMGSGYRAQPLRGLMCPGQELDPNENFDDFLRRTRRCSNYGRRRRWLERQEGFRIEVCTDPDDLSRPLDEFFRLHAMRWSEDGGSAGITGSSDTAFHREATAALAASGKLRLYTMYLGETAVASVYGLVHNHRFYYYQSGMDPAWRSRSVGLVLIGETFADVIGSGLKRYDFLRGEESYKSDWVGDHRQLVAWRLFADHSRGHHAAAIDSGLRKAKRTVKRTLSTIRRTAHP